MSRNVVPRGESYHRSVTSREGRVSRNNGYARVARGDVGHVP